MISMFLSAMAAITGWPPKVIPCDVHAAAGEERLHHALARHERTDRGVGGGEALRGGDEVRRDAEALGCEPVAEAPEAGDHLVEAEQDAVPVAQLAHPFEVARGRHERAAAVLDRLDDDHRHRLGPGLADRPLELVQQEGGELLLGLVGRPVVAVRVRHVQHVRDERLEGGAQVLHPLMERAPMVVPW